MTLAFAKLNGGCTQRPICALLFVLVIFVSVGTSSVDWSPPTRISHGAWVDGSVYMVPYISLDGSNLHVVWMDGRENVNEDYDLHFASSSDGGTTWQTDRRIDTKGFSNSRPKMIANGSELHIVLKESNTFWHVYSTDGGTTWQNESIVSRGQTVEDFDLAIEDGNLYLVWSEWNSSGAFYELFLVKSSDLGASWSIPTFIVSVTESHAYIGLDASEGWLHVVTDGGYILSSDAGDTWNPLNDSLNGADVSADGAIVHLMKGNAYGYEGYTRSEDFGSTWSSVNTSVQGRIAIIGKHVYVVNGSQYFLSSNRGLVFDESNIIPDMSPVSPYATSVAVDKMGRAHIVYVEYIVSEGHVEVFYVRSSPPDPGPFQGTEKFVFMSARSGNWDIWTMDIDGSDPIQLTTDLWDDLFPHWSPDAEKIAYANWNDTNSDIWVMDEDGSNKTQLTTHPSGDFYPVWSPDGTKIAFTSRRDGGDSDIWVMDADGSNKMQLTTNASDDRHPSWSPDGSKIAFATDMIPDHNIWMMDPDGSNKTQLHSDAGWDLYPVWSLDGTKIAFNSDRTFDYEIWTMSPDGGNQTQLTFLPGEDSCSCWSPDSSRIAFSSFQSGNGEIWIMSRDGGNQTQVTSDPADDICPDIALLPDDTPPLPPVLRSAVLTGGNLENVLVTWNASEDEGSPVGTVKYEIWRAMSYSGPYSLLNEVTANGSPFYSYSDVAAGHGDPSSYFYRIQSVDAMDNRNVTRDTAGKFVRGLQPGINSVSIPLVQFDESLQNVLQTVPYDKAWYYDSLTGEWMYYVSFKQYKRNLNHLDHRKGLWIEAVVSSNLTVAGMVPAQTTIQLRTGWNLVSFPSFNSSYSVSDLMTVTGATRVEGYDPGSPYCLRVLAPSDMLQTGFGYWVRVDADSDWIVEVS